LDTVIVEGLELSIIIGVYEWEHVAPRPIFVDFELDMDLRPAAASDHVRDAVDYAAVCATIKTVAGAERLNLIETLAERIGRALFAEFPIHAVRIRISKPGAVDGTRDIAVKIERRREDYAVCGR
jgi:dihydroneopterin aldolase